MATRKAPVLTCRFYVTPAGNEPVREWLKAQSVDVKKAIGADIRIVQWGWPIGKPRVDGLGTGLFEVRTSVGSNIYRVLFCVQGSIMVLLHGFQKKTQKTPKADLDLARKRSRNEEK
jgi:phage-related protein